MSLFYLQLNLCQFNLKSPTFSHNQEAIASLSSLSSTRAKSGSVTTLSARSHRSIKPDSTRSISDRPVEFLYPYRVGDLAGKPPGIRFVLWFCSTSWLTFLQQSDFTRFSWRSLMRYAGAKASTTRPAIALLY